MRNHVCHANRSYAVVFLIVLFLSVLTFGSSKTEKELDVKDLYKSDHIVLLKVFSTMCGTCKMFQPEWLKLKKHIGDKLQIYEVDIGQSGLVNCLVVRWLVG